MTLSVAASKKCEGRVMPQPGTATQTVVVGEEEPANKAISGSPFKMMAASAEDVAKRGVSRPAETNKITAD